MKKFDDLYKKIKMSIIKESKDSSEKSAKIVYKLINGKFNSLDEFKKDTSLIDEFKKSSREDKEEILKKFYENIENLDENLNKEKIDNLTTIHTFLKELV